MTRPRRWIVVTCLFLLGSPAAVAAADPAPELAGEWFSEEGSHMRIALSPGGALSGEYSTAVGRAAGAVRYPLTGFASGDQVGFCVDWSRPRRKRAGDAASIASMTCWVGQHTHRRGKEELRTVWLLDRNVPDDAEAEQLWSAVRTGSSVFRRTPPADPPARPVP